MNRIMFAGPSGIGKSTLARWLAEQLQELFVSGSVSDLLPDTRDIPHSEMLNKTSKDAQMEDYQIINLRNKLYQKYETFVTDRSYLDSAAYFYYKQVKELPACELEHFLELCKMLLNKQCDKLILLSWDINQAKEWIIEDNNKRIQSPYFQIMISQIMEMVLGFWGAVPVGERIMGRRYGAFNSKLISYQYGAQRYVISSPYGVTEVLELNELMIENRKDIIKIFLDL